MRTNRCISILSWAQIKIYINNSIFNHLFQNSQYGNQSTFFYSYSCFCSELDPSRWNWLLSSNDLGSKDKYSSRCLHCVHWQWDLLRKCPSCCYSEAVSKGKQILMFFFLLKSYSSQTFACFSQKRCWR